MYRVLTMARHRRLVGGFHQEQQISRFDIFGLRTFRRRQTGAVGQVVGFSIPAVFRMLRGNLDKRRPLRLITEARTEKRDQSITQRPSIGLSWAIGTRPPAVIGNVDRSRCEPAAGSRASPIADCSA